MRGSVGKTLAVNPVDLSSVPGTLWVRERTGSCELPPDFGMGAMARVCPHTWIVKK